MRLHQPKLHWTGLVKSKEREGEMEREGEIEREISEYSDMDIFCITVLDRLQNLTKRQPNFPFHY